MPDAREIRFRDGLAPCAETGESRKQGGAQDGRVQLVEPAVHAEMGVNVFGSLSVIAQRPRLGRDRRLLREERSAIAHATKVLGWIEARARCVADRAHGLTTA